MKHGALKRETATTKWLVFFSVLALLGVFVAISPGCSAIPGSEAMRDKGALNQDGESACNDSIQEDETLKLEGSTFQFEGSANTEAIARMSAAQDAVTELTQRYGDYVAVAVRYLDSDVGFDINGPHPFVSASMIKMLVLAEFLDEIDMGVLNPGEEYILSSSDVVGGTGSIQSQPVGVVYDYDDLACYMIKCSDNIATNILIDRMGMDAINAKASRLGLMQTVLQRRMMELNSGIENYTSALDMAELFADIAKGTLASKDSCVRAEGYLKLQEDSLGIAAGLPDDVEFGHKTGSLNTVRHDGGIVYAEYPYVIVVLTNIGASPANNLMASISSVVYDALVADVVQ